MIGPIVTTAVAILTDSEGSVISLDPASIVISFSMLISDCICSSIHCSGYKSLLSINMIAFHQLFQ
ncbi:hypothetical protein D3C78_1952310 [compost metagenome]